MPPPGNAAPAAADLDQTLAALLAQLGELTNNMARLHGTPQEVSPQQPAPGNAAPPPVPPPATDNTQQPPPTPTTPQQPSSFYDQPAHALQHQHSQQDLQPTHDSATASSQAPQTLPTPPPQSSPFMAMSQRLQSQATRSLSDPSLTAQPSNTTHPLAPSADTTVSDARAAALPPRDHSPLQPNRTRSPSRQTQGQAGPAHHKPAPGRGGTRDNSNLPAPCHTGRGAGHRRPTTTT